jgi:hypothetical protein
MPPPSQLILALPLHLLLYLTPPQAKTTMTTSHIILLKWFHHHTIMHLLVHHLLSMAQSVLLFVGCLIRILRMNSKGALMMLCA